MMLFIAMLVLLAGSACLSLSLRRHHKQWLGTPEAPRGRVLMLRIAGYSALTVSAALCIVAEGWGVGLTLYCGFLTVAVAAVAVANSTRPQSRSGAA
ncbi:MAG: DUF3325 domain-containing protein [Pseudomonadota bacterium]